MTTKKTEFDTAKAAEKTAQDALSAANQAIKANRDPEVAETLQAAFATAQAMFDTAAAATAAAKFYYDSLRDQQEADAAEFNAGLKAEADAERAGRETAMTEAMATKDAKLAEKTAKEAMKVTKQTEFDACVSGSDGDACRDTL
jgi:hypothetical protein